MMIYEETYKPRVSDFDTNDNLKPFAILDMFQSVASEHAKLLNLGYEDLLKKDIVWVLLRSKYEIIKPICFGEKFVTVKTWPHKAGRVDFDRDYEIYNAKGELCVKASSKWCFLNLKTRRIAVGCGLGYPTDDYFPQKNFEEGLKKIADFSVDGCQKYDGFAGRSSLDHNGHVNNAKYAEFILDAIDLNGETIKSFEINYIRELSVGNYTLYHKKDGNKRLIKGFSGENESFRAEIIT